MPKGRFALREGTFAGDHGSDANARFPVVRQVGAEPVKSTLTGQRDITAYSAGDALFETSALGTTRMITCFALLSVETNV
jgi:hypothetical protein